VIKTDVLSIRLVPTIFLSNDVLAGRAGTTPASPTDDLVVKYTLPHSLDHHLTLIDGTNPATRLSTYAQWSKHVLSTAFNNLYLSFHIYPTPDELHIASLCEEGLWEGESCHISTIFVKTIFTKLDDMVVMLDRAVHLNYIRAEFWDCPTDLIYNQIPDVANPGARLQTEPTFMLETPMPATPGGTVSYFRDFSRLFTPRFNVRTLPQTIDINNITISSVPTAGPMPMPPPPPRTPSSSSTLLVEKLKLTPPAKFKGLKEERQKDPTWTVKQYLEQIDNYFACTTNTDESQYRFARDLFFTDAKGHVTQFEFTHPVSSRKWPIFREYMRKVLFSKVTETEDREYLKTFKMPSPLNFNTLTDYNTQFLALAANSQYSLTDSGDDMMLRQIYMENMEKPLKRDLFRDQYKFPSETITSRECLHLEDSPDRGKPFDLTALITASLKRISTRDNHRILLSDRLGKRKASDDDDDSDSPPSKRGKTNDTRMVRRNPNQSAKGGSLNSVSEVKALKTFDEDLRLEAWRKAGKPKPGDDKAPLGFFNDGSPRTCNKCNSMTHFLKDCPQLKKTLQRQMNALNPSSDDAKPTNKKVRFRDDAKGKGKKTGNPSSLNAMMEDPDELSDSDPEKQEDDEEEDGEVFSDDDTPSSRMLNSMMSKLNTKEKELLNSMKGNSPGPSSRQAPDPAKERARIAELMRH
jgi:hypothetical protein